MARLSDSQTSLSLMETLRQSPKDADAWDRFVRRYRPKIYGWCRAWGLQEADADDVAQDVISKLTQKMADFRYDQSRSFRAWLKTITQHALSDLVASRSRAVGSQSIPILETIEARADLERRIEEIFNHELLELAIAKVRATSRASNVGRLPPDGLRRMLGCRGVAAPRNPSRICLCRQASSPEASQTGTRRA